MTVLRNILIFSSTILVIFGSVELLLMYRSAQMRALAKRLGLSFTAGNNHIWKLIFRHKMYPNDLRLHPFQMTSLWGTMNVIEGHCGSIRIVVLDSLFHFGARTDRYITFIGAKAEADPFLLRYGKEKVNHSNGWFTLYRTRFSILTWSLGVERIEDHLHAIGEQSKIHNYDPHLHLEKISP